jgi:hypothetical protein
VVSLLLFFGLLLPRRSPAVLANWTVNGVECCQNWIASLATGFERNPYVDWLLAAHTAICIPPTHFIVRLGGVWRALHRSSTSYTWELRDEFLFSRKFLMLPNELLQFMPRESRLPWEVILPSLSCELPKLLNHS